MSKNIFFLVQYILPTCISNRACVLFLAFTINVFHLGDSSFRSAISFSIATHDRFQNISSGYAKMTRSFLHQRNMKKSLFVL